MHGADCSALQLERIIIAHCSKFENDGCELETCCLARTRVDEIVLDSCPRSDLVGGVLRPLPSASEHVDGMQKTTD